MNTDVDPSRLLPNFNTTSLRDTMTVKCTQLLWRSLGNNNGMKCKLLSLRLHSEVWPLPAHTAAKQTVQSTPTNADAANAFKPNSESTGIPTISTVPALSTTSGSIANSDSYLWVPSNAFRAQVNYKRKQQQLVIAEIYGFLIGVDWTLPFLS